MSVRYAATSGRRIDAIVVSPSTARRELQDVKEAVGGRGGQAVLAEGLVPQDQILHQRRGVRGGGRWVMGLDGRKIIVDPRGWAERGRSLSGKDPSEGRSSACIRALNGQECRRGRSGAACEGQVPPIAWPNRCRCWTHVRDRAIARTACRDRTRQFRCGGRDDPRAQHAEPDLSEDGGYGHWDGRTDSRGEDTRPTREVAARKYTGSAHDERKRRRANGKGHGAGGPAKAH